jgi:hypothetical protein
LGSTERINRTKRANTRWKDLLESQELGSLIKSPKYPPHKNPRSEHLPQQNTDDEVKTTLNM